VSLLAATDLKGGLDRRRLAAAEHLHIAAAACMVGGSPAISRRSHENLAGQLQGGLRAFTSVKPPSDAQPEELLLIAHVACVQGKCLKSATYVVVNPCEGPIASMLFQVSGLMLLQSDDPRYRPTLPEQVSSAGLRGIYRHLCLLHRSICSLVYWLALGFVAAGHERAVPGGHGAAGDGLPALLRSAGRRQRGE